MVGGERIGDDCMMCLLHWHLVIERAVVGAVQTLVVVVEPPVGYVAMDALGSFVMLRRHEPLSWHIIG